MEKLTTEQIKQFSNTTFGREVGKHISRQVVGELLFYRQLAEEIGCPLEVKCQLCDGKRIYTCNGEAKITNCFDKDMFIQQKDGERICLLYCDYKNNWWLKADRSE